MLMSPGLRSMRRFHLAYSSPDTDTSSMVGATLGVVGSSTASYCESSSAASPITARLSSPSCT